MSSTALDPRLPFNVTYSAGEVSGDQYKDKVEVGIYEVDLTRWCSDGDRPNLLDHEPTVWCCIFFVKKLLELIWLARGWRNWLLDSQRSRT